MCRQMYVSEMSYAKLHTQALGTLVFKHLIWQSHRDTRHLKVVYCIFALVCVYVCLCECKHFLSHITECAEMTGG